MSKFKRGSLALARQVFNTPQLIIEPDLQRIAQFLVDRANHVEFSVDEDFKSEVVNIAELKSLSAYSTEEEKQKYHRRLDITNDGKRGNLSVTGTLVAKAGEIGDGCMELTSYEKLLSVFQMQVKEGINELVLHVDSGGGSAFSCFEVAQEVRTLADKNNIKITAFVDGLSASAAYAWTSIADEVVARKGSEIGSVGVVVQLINNSKMLEDVGITRKFITYGDSKVPFDDNGEFTPKFISSIQKKVNATGLEFANFVAKNRNMTLESVIATQAEVFTADEALEIGFIDKIMTRSEFFDEYLPNAQSQNMNNQQQYFLQQEDHMSKDVNQQTAEELATLLATEQEKAQKLLADYTNADAALTILKASHEKLNTDFSELKAKYQALVEEKEEAELSAKLAERKTTLESLLGKENEKLDALVETTTAMSDEAFQMLTESMGLMKSAKAQSMEEFGDEGQQANKQKEIEKEKTTTAAERIAAKAKSL